METTTIILEYLRVLLSPQMVVGAAGLVVLLTFREDIKALLLRVAKIRLPGGAEVSTSQTERKIAEQATEDKPAPIPSSPLPGLPAGLTEEHRAAIEGILKAERATSYLWEYRYLNYFLVYKTQLVLDWLVGLPQPTTFGHYDATWLPLVPSANERAAMIDALQAHHLIQVTGDAIQVTPKGREYQQWRGDLPPVGPTAT
jgi:hypothetical protein